ncbi:MAG: aspartate-semialdehyde dehydrogenase [Defluviitaleaceae bacterium]|nr:aspartate-semialdehyde dehydrogenase [Defluviitaleaceae bacterium]
MKEINIGLVGASGIVGLQFLKILEQRKHNVKNLYLFASKTSAGKKLSFKGKEYIIEELDENSFDREMDFVFFCASNDISAKYAPIAKEKGVIVIDNSSHFRLNKDVPLVVPEINSHLLKEHKGIVANPNCSTIQAVLVLAPINKIYGIKRVVISTYQAVSGAGKEGIQDLVNGYEKTSWQTGRIRDAFVDTEHEMNPINILTPRHHYELNTFGEYIAGNIIPYIGEILEDGYSEEELKIINETKKILELPDLKITATAVRVPVINGHSESINIELERSYQLNSLKRLLLSTNGIELVDTPTPLKSSGKDAIFVGRIRKDFSTNGVNLFSSSDNLRKGAALNGVQIMEALINMQTVENNQ